MTRIVKLPLLHLPGITAFSTMRDADDPADPYSGFSVCHYTADNPAHVADCRKVLAAGLGLEPDHLIIPRQSHTANVFIVDETPVDDRCVENVDALVTRNEPVALCISTADCVPIVMADPDAGVIAAAHSGWRGTVADIAGKTVRAMLSLGARAERIHAATGPAICADCFEVGKEVAEVFRNTYPHTPGIVRDNFAKPHIDLRLAITHSLVEAGISPKHITASGACPHCDPDRYFSARRLGTASGRTLTLIIKDRRDSCAGTHR